MWSMNQVLHHLQVLFGLVTTGFGVVEGMYTNVVIGQEEGPGALTCMEAGLMALAAMHGIGAIGDNLLNVQMCK